MSKTPIEQEYVIDELIIDGGKIGFMLICNDFKPLGLNTGITNV